jgi:hypothetical protein
MKGLLSNPTASTMWMNQDARRAQPVVGPVAFIARTEEEAAGFILIDTP